MIAEVEEAVIRSFVVRRKQERYISFLNSPKRRREFLRELYHFRDFDSACIVPVARSHKSARRCSEELYRRGAGNECYVVSRRSRPGWDDRRLASVVAKVSARKMELSFVHSGAPGLLRRRTAGKSLHPVPHSFRRWPALVRKAGDLAGSPASKAETASRGDRSTLQILERRFSQRAVPGCTGSNQVTRHSKTSTSRATSWWSSPNRLVRLGEPSLAFGTIYAEGQRRYVRAPVRYHPPVS